MQQLIALLYLLLGAPIVALADAGDGCSPPTLTDADAMRWMGSPVQKLSSEGRAYALAAVQAAKLRAETQKMRVLYSVDGSNGKAALEELRDKGFACRFEVLQGLRLDETGVLFKPADLPSYRCSRADAAACICRRFQITFGLGPKPPGDSVAHYASAVESMILDRKHVSYSCHDD